MERYICLSYFLTISLFLVLLVYELNGILQALFFDYSNISFEFYFLFIYPDMQSLVVNFLLSSAIG
jgi:hypothetical protein